MKRRWSGFAWVSVAVLSISWGCSSAPVKSVGQLAAGEAGERVEIRAAGADTVIVNHREDGGHYALVDAKGAVKWEAVHKECPVAGQLAMFGIGAGHIVCKSGQTIIGVSLETGAKAWTWSSADKLFITAVAGDKVFTSVDNKVLAVLDAGTGEVVRRFELPPASPLEAAAVGPQGPMGLVITRFGSANPQLAAQPAGDAPASDAVQPFAPLWEVPFRAYSADLGVGDQSVVGRPKAGLVVNHDLATGERRWVERAGLLPRLWLRDGVGLFRATLEDGTRVVGAFDPASRTVRWEHRWPFAAPTSVGYEQSGYAAFGGADGWAVYRATDGAPVATGKQGIRGLELSDKAVTLAVKTQGGSRLAQVPYARKPPLPALEHAATTPRWLVPGATLYYGLVLHDGYDAATGYPKDPKFGTFDVTIRKLAPDIVFDWASSDGRKGTRVIPEAVLAKAHTHSDLYGASEGKVTMDRTSIWVSREVMAQLTAAGSTAFNDVSAGRTSQLDERGPFYHRVELVEGGGERTVDVPVLRAEAGEARYWLTRDAEHPLLVRAERPRFAVWLASVAPPATR